MEESSLPRFNDVEENECDELKDTECAEEEVEPHIGMVFDSVDSLVKYYRRYGNKMGFEAMIRTSKKGDDGIMRYVTVACSCSGKERSKCRNTLKKQPVAKTDCKSRISATLNGEYKWEIKSVVLEHNHDLTSPTKRRYFKVNQTIQPFVKMRLQVNDQAGIRPCKNFQSCSGGVEDLSFLQKDCRNYIEKVRRLRLGVGDTSAVLEYFMKMQKENSNFWYMIDVDEESRLKNVLWVDARCRAAYKDFGDVVTFDTTYLTNKYDMPFAAFVGVDHHGHSTLLGCGLISHEDTETFVWLFRSWLECMDVAPNGIITDQDKAMQNAIEIVFPSTRHRWCLWHIMKKLPEKLREYNEYETIKFTLQNIVYDSLAREEFEERWNKFIDVYNLHENEWLSGLYKERVRWVPAFLKDTFWAGMSTTQRSEIMHAFFDGYVNSKTTLKQFVEQYDNALRDKVEKEREADFRSFKSWIPCITNYPIEKQFQNAYTTAKFKEFQEEIAGKIYCELSFLKKSDLYEEYQVLEDIWFGDSNRRVPFLVYFEEISCDIRCNCHLFEFKGILCRHALIVLIHKRVSHIPDKYILRRWRKNIKRCHTKIKVSYNRWSTNVEGQRFEKLSNLMLTVADMASNNEEDCNMLMELITRVKNQLEQKEDEGGFVSKEGDNPQKEGNSLIDSPRVARSKGRPPCKRKQSKVDEIVRRAKNKKLRKQRLGKESSAERANITETVLGTQVLSNDIVATQLSTGPVQNLEANSNLCPGQEDVNDEHVSLGEI